MVYSMNRGLSCRTITVFILSILFFSCTLAFISPLAENVNMGGSRQVTENRVNVYFHNDSTMDTQWNSRPVKWQTPLFDGDERDFALDPPLMNDLKLRGRNFGANYGFRIWLETVNPQPNDNADITIKVLENIKVVASRTFTIPNGEQKFDYEVFFVDNKEYYTFSSGSVIHVNINVSTTGQWPITISYDSGSNEGYLILDCINIDETKDIIVKAQHSDGSLGKFYPNLPNTEQRQIHYRGSVTDKFGAYDVQSVSISSPGILDGEVDATYEYAHNEPTGHFKYNYTYETGLTPGDYTFTAHVTDNSNNMFSKSNFLTVATYGVYLECQDPTGEGLPNEVVEFDVDVYNVGGQSDAMKLTATPSLSGWGAEFEGGGNTGLLEPGEFVIKTLKVTVASNAKKNDECTVEVWGESTNDPSEDFKLVPSIIVQAKPDFDFEFINLNSLEQNVSADGGSVEYEFKLKNKGQEDDVYTITGDAPASGSGWSAILSTTKPSATKKSDLEYEVPLEGFEEANFVYTVTAQPNPSEKIMTLNVQATGKNSTDTIIRTSRTKIKGDAGEITLTPSQTTKAANPGESIDANDTMEVVFELDAFNEDQLNTFEVNIETGNLPTDWSQSISPDNFDIDPEKTKKVTLTLDIPETTPAKPTGGYTFTITARYSTEGSSTKQTSVDLAVTIPKVFNVLLEADETEKSTEAGVQVSYEISVINKGNVEDEQVEITYNTISGWDININNPTITLGDYDSVVRVTITLTPSTSVATGDDGKGILDVKVRAEGSIISNTITLKTTVEKDVSEQLTNFLYEYWYIPIFVIIIFILTYVIRSRMK